MSHSPLGTLLRTMNLQKIQWKRPCHSAIRLGSLPLPECSRPTTPGSGGTFSCHHPRKAQGFTPSLSEPPPQGSPTQRYFPLSILSHSDYTSLMRKLVGLTRYTVFVPAIASILGALFLMAQGSIAVVITVINSVVEQTPLKDVIVEVLTAVDAILLGTVLLVIGYGLYELFVDTELDVPAWLQIKDLDDLKSKLIGVVVAIIAVVFVGVLVDSTRAGDVLAYGAGAGAVVLGLGVFAWATRKSASPDKR